jgi:CheY-like chemotaxis protein
VGVGSSFFFTLPMDTAAIEQAADPPPLARVAGMRTLIVDDNRSSGALLRAILLGWGMIPTVVASGEEALAELERAALRGEPHALLLVDHRMPGMDGFALAERIRQLPGEAATMLMMFSGEGLHAHAARCRKLGMAGYLMKPITPLDLREAILTALGEPAHPATLRPIREADRANWRELDLLLAEDNLVNRTLAIHLLEKLGHRVTVAHNGVEAVRLWQAGSFDAILMDLHMPELNGYEACAQIRALEAGTGRHVPIVALTAHAMEGARAECLLRGMDGYLTKPIDTGALWNQLEALALGREPTPLRAQPPKSLVVADFDQALAIMEGDRELLDEITEQFLVDAPVHVRALASGTDEQIAHHAHTLKGMVGLFGAERCRRAALWVERDVHLPTCADAVAELESACAELFAAIRQHQEAHAGERACAVMSSG